MRHAILLCTLTAACLAGVARAQTVDVETQLTILDTLVEKGVVDASTRALLDAAGKRAATPAHKAHVLLLTARMAEGEGDFYKIYVSFYPEDVENLYEIFELVKDQETTKVYLNNKLIPYIQDLWLFLMWFHRVK